MDNLYTCWNRGNFHRDSETCKGNVSEISDYSEDLKQKLPALYSKDLIELLFYEFYTKTQYIEEGMKVTRKTAVNYLNQLKNGGFLSSQKIGRGNNS